MVNSPGEQTPRYLRDAVDQSSNHLAVELIRIFRLLDAEDQNRLLSMARSMASAPATKVDGSTG